jgi:indolepyruvate ferredoxin oxidoreductase
MQDYKIYAALAYAREQAQSHHHRFARRQAGHHRLRQILSGRAGSAGRTGHRRSHGGRIGLRLFKVAMPWPLEPDSVREFAQGLDEILVVEEKRQIVEYQLKEQLYNWRDDVRPRVIGKFDEKANGWRRAANGCCRQG